METFRFFLQKKNKKIKTKQQQQKLLSCPRVAAESDSSPLGRTAEVSGPAAAGRAEEQRPPAQRGGHGSPAPSSRCWHQTPCFASVSQPNRSPTFYTPIPNIPSIPNHAHPPPTARPIHLPFWGGCRAAAPACCAEGGVALTSQRGADNSLLSPSPFWVQAAWRDPKVGDRLATQGREITEDAGFKLLL